MLAAARREGPELTMAQLEKLHDLAALRVAETEEARAKLREELQGLVHLVDAVRRVEVPKHISEATGIPDARIWPENQVQELADENAESGQASFEDVVPRERLLANAKVSERGLFVVDTAARRTPE